MKEYLRGEEEKKKAKEAAAKIQDQEREKEMEIRAKAKEDEADVFNRRKGKANFGNVDIYQRMGGMIGANLDTGRLTRQNEQEKMQAEIKEINKKMEAHLEKIRQAADVQMDEIKRSQDSEAF